MEINEALERIKPLQTPRRYAHTLRVLETAADMARRFKADIQITGLTAALHDCAKDISETLIPVYGDKIGDFILYPEVYHAPLGAFYAEDVLKIKDRRVLDGIFYHCTGRPAMPVEEKIVYLADALEPGRSYDGAAELRRTLAENGLNRTVAEYAESNLNYLSKRGGLIHPLTKDTLEFYRQQSE